MPVHFKGASEYETHYKWLGSFKSQSFEPEPEQAMDPAGQPSSFSHITMEPPMQQKKRLGGPPTSLSTEYFAVPSRRPDYQLLGTQEKFAHNVRYRPKQSGAEQNMHKNKENFDDPPPPNKQLKMQKRIKPLIKERHPPISRSVPSSNYLSPPPAPRDARDNMELKVALKDKDLKDVLEDKPTKNKSEVIKQSKAVANATKVVDEAKKDRPKAAPTPPVQSESLPKQTKASNMNEFVQTNMKKGVADSAPEAPADYALKYKAGVAPPRVANRFSEYQKQFQWKKGLKASPILAAEEIVYKSHGDLGPYKIDPIGKISEYNREFKSWKTQAYAAVDDFNVNNNAIDDDKEQRKPVKRSKSASALRQKEARGKRDERDEESEVATELKAKLSQTHGKAKRRTATEYMSNFKAPAKFSYQQGTWKGAFAPQEFPQMATDQATDMNNNENNNNENAPEPLSNWFAEVVELRKRAEEYRKRAQGTHFSREHLVQLMAKQNACWDLASATSDTLNALDLEVPGKEITSKQLVDDVPVEICSHEATEGDSPQYSDLDDAEAEQLQQGKRKSAKKGGKRKVSRKSRKMAWMEEHRVNVAEQKRKLEEERRRLQEEAFGEDDTQEEKEEGRLPTPLFMQQQRSNSPARRHHLNLTTPSVGGAILTCPPSKDNKMVVTSRSGESYVTPSDDYPTKSAQKTYTMDKLLTMPTLGQPSGDTHPLRDDNVDHDKPLQTQYVMSPPLPVWDEDKENVSKSDKPSKKRGKMAKPTNLSTVKEGFGNTWACRSVGLDDIKARVGPKDDDVMSVSLQSVASSASLASDVLERAKRRQEFWNQDES